MFYSAGNTLTFRVLSMLKYGKRFENERAEFSMAYTAQNVKSLVVLIRDVLKKLPLQNFCFETSSFSPINFHFMNRPKCAI